ncbi:MAG: SH3 domain-containing protein [Bdellovibrionaceae bacterium]|nr:SH3 domain-containing protein [Pseudobdellovibrionaceae bacterium]
MENFKAAPRALFTLIFLLVLSSPLEARDTPKYERCLNREGGEWNYGRGPEVCTASVHGEDSFIKTQMNVIVFGDAKARETERKRYATEMNALLREAARVYMKKRKPNVSEAELANWTLGVLATAAHESRWSHYRTTSDGRLKMMRGDFGHGHGLMQIDDRAHYPAIQQGIAWNLATNVTYAMDIYYAAWQLAPSASCVGNATNWIPRIRAAWSVYNGGGGKTKLCRWTKPNDPWAKNDKNFLSILTGRAWQKLVTDAGKQTDVPVACLMEKRENCAGTTPPSEKPENLLEGRFYRLSDAFCLAKNGQLHCLDDERDRQCLKDIGPVTAGNAIELTKDKAARYVRHDEDRHLLCASYDRSLLAVGEGFELRKNINLRVTPGGGLLATLPAGSRWQVRDFELRNDSKDRYYRVQSGEVEGYLYVGDADSASQWAVPVDAKLAQPTSLARVGENVLVNNAAGINLRAAPGGTLLTAVPKGQTVKVLEVTARTTNNKIYYKVQYGSRTGYIHAGSILPADTLPDWAEPKR